MTQTKATRANELKDLFNQLVEATESTVNSTCFTTGLIFNGVFTTPDGISFRLSDIQEDSYFPQVELSVEDVYDHADTEHLLSYSKVKTSLTGDKRFIILLDAVNMLRKNALRAKGINNDIPTGTVMQQSISTILTDDRNHSKIDATISVNEASSCFLLQAKGYSDCNSQDDTGIPLVIENINGVLTLRVFADINQEDPTHVIPLNLAKNKNRLHSVD